MSKSDYIKIMYDYVWLHKNCVWLSLNKNSTRLSMNIKKVLQDILGISIWSMAH